MYQVFDFESEVFKDTGVLRHQIELCIIRQLIILIHIEFMINLLSLANFADSALAPQNIILLLKYVYLCLCLSILSDLFIDLLSYLFCIFIQMPQSGMHV